VWGARCNLQGDIDTARAAGDWKTAERALKSWSAAGSTTGFDSPAHASAYAATVRAEVAMHARRLSDARSLALEALDAVPHFAVCTAGGRLGVRTRLV